MIHRNIAALFLTLTLGTQLLGQPGAGTARTPTRGEVFDGLRRAMTLSSTGDLPAARELCNAALAFGTSKNDAAVLAWARQTLGYVEFRGGRLDAAEAAFAEAMKGFEVLKLEANLAACHANLARLSAAGGKHAAVIEHAGHAAALYKKLGKTADAASALLDAAASHEAAGAAEEAVKVLTEALDTLGDAAAADSTLTLRIGNRLGAALVNLGRGADALPYLDQAVESAKRLHDEAELGTALAARGLLRHGTGDLDLALADTQAALAIQEKQKDAKGAAATRCNLGCLLREKGDAKGALESLTAAAAAERALKNSAEEARCLYNIALVHEDAGVPDRAIEAYAKCLELRKSTKDIAGQVRAIEGLAAAHAQRGDTEKAKAFQAEADLLRKNR